MQDAMASQPRSMPIPPPPTRAVTTVLPSSESTPSFLIGANKSYRTQYANIYFTRLNKLRKFVEKSAVKRWRSVSGNPKLVQRVLDITKSKLCYIIGTVYMDMPLKPNVLIDIARDRSIPPPPPPEKYFSPEDSVMLEDESGRVHLVGDCIRKTRLVTGIIIGALGMETHNGDFEVVDICTAEMIPQTVPLEESSHEAMDVDDAQHPDESADEWIGAVSGLSIGAASPSDALIQLLVEYLVGESGDTRDQISAAQISRLIIAGNSLETVALPVRGEVSPLPGEDKKARRYGYDATTFSPHPMLSLSSHLLDIGRLIPVHILPGEADPSGTIMPQQPFPHAMFGAAGKKIQPTLVCETNPTYLRLATGSGPENGTRPLVTRTILVNSGQPLNDMFKYLPSPPHTRLSTVEATLHWRHIAPTAPDTLWCHPFEEADPFIMTATPDIYIVGGQKAFATKIACGPSSQCRIVLVPHFAQTGTMVLINVRTLSVKCITFAGDGMSGTKGDLWKPEETQAPNPTLQELMSSMPSSSASQDVREYEDER